MNWKSLLSILWASVLLSLFPPTLWAQTPPQYQSGYPIPPPPDVTHRLGPFDPFLRVAVVPWRVEGRVEMGVEELEQVTYTFWTEELAGLGRALLLKTDEVEALLAATPDGAEPTAASVQQVAQALAADVVLVYNLDASAPTVRLQAWVYRVSPEDQTLTPLAPIRQEAPWEELLTLYSRALMDLMDRLGLEPTAEEAERLRHPPTENLEAYRAFVRGRSCAWSQEAETARQAPEAYAQAIRLDPQFAAPVRDLAWWQYTREGNVEGALALLRRALTLEPYHPEAYELLGTWLFWDAVRAKVPREEVERWWDQALRGCPRPYIVLRAGDYYNRVGERARAIQILREGVARFPERNMYQLVGLFCEAYGDDTAAAEMFAEGAARYPEDASMHQGLGRARQRLGELEAAAAAFRRALELRPEDSVVRSMLVHVYRQTNQWDQAIAEFQQLLQEKPEDVNVHLALALSYFEAKRWPEALAAYERLAQIDPNQKEMAQSFIEAIYARDYHLDPALQQKVTLELEDTSIHLAVEELATHLPRPLTTLPVQPPPLVTLQIQDRPAVEAMDELARQVGGKWTRFKDGYFLQDFKPAVPPENLLTPEERQAWEQIIAEGHQLFVAKQYEEARQRYLQALEKVPRHVETLENVGKTYFYQWDYKEAASWFEKALRINPDEAQARLWLGGCLFWQAEYDQALTHLLRLVEGPPPPAPPRGVTDETIDPRWLARFRIGRIKAAQGHPQEAEQWYREYLTVQPESGAAHFYLGVSLYEQERWKDSVAEFKLAEQLDPTYTEKIETYLEAIRQRLGAAQPSDDEESPAESPRPPEGTGP